MPKRLPSFSIEFLKEGVALKKSNNRVDQVGEEDSEKRSTERVEAT
jgi:hypothetical protein